jgi:hypothetical protein
MGAFLINNIRDLPGLQNDETAWLNIVHAGPKAFSETYPYVYYTSIVFGAVSIVVACFLADVSQYMNDHVAVVIY